MSPFPTTGDNEVHVRLVIAVCTFTTTLFFQIIKDLTCDIFLVPSIIRKVFKFKNF